MLSVSFLQSFILVFPLFQLIAADCRATSTDYVDGGGRHCVNSTPTDYFSFGIDFSGGQKSPATSCIVTPMLIDPSGNLYSCSDVAITHDGVEMISTW